jgi:hypothetical protein
MKKIILILFSSLIFTSFGYAKTIIFKNCFYAYDSKFDNKKWEKNEIIVDTNLRNAKFITIYTNSGLITETERIKDFKELGNYKPEKVSINNHWRVEYADNKYVKLVYQSGKSKLTLNLDNYTVDQTFLVNGVPGNTFRSMTCENGGSGSGGAKDTLKKIIGK